MAEVSQVFAGILLAGAQAVSPAFSADSSFRPQLDERYIPVANLAAANTTSSFQDLARWALDTKGSMSCEKFSELFQRYDDKQLLMARMDEKLGALYESAFKVNGGPAQRDAAASAIEARGCTNPSKNKAPAAGS